MKPISQEVASKLNVVETLTERNHLLPGILWVGQSIHWQLKGLALHKIIPGNFCKKYFLEDSCICVLTSKSYRPELPRAIHRLFQSPSIQNKTKTWKSHCLRKWKSNLRCPALVRLLTGTVYLQQRLMSLFIWNKHVGLSDPSSCLTNRELCLIKFWYSHI